MRSMQHGAESEDAFAARYAEQLARTRISIFRDFRFHRAVLDESYLMPYTIADTVLTENLKASLRSIQMNWRQGHMAGAGQLEHPSRASACCCRLKAWR